MTDDQTIIIVSGLPRSGTSLMMQILQAGGVPIMTDAVRLADTSNPRGYFEYEKVLRLPADNSWLGEARGKALKVIVQLLPFLDRRFRYKVLIMQREIQEILQSQTRMIANLGKAAIADTQKLAGIFERNLATANELASTFPDMASHPVEFADLFNSPGTVVDQIVGFLDRPSLDREAMIQAVDTGLYRNKIARLDSQ